MEGVNFSDKEYDLLSRDEKFILKVKQIVESNLGNEHFSVKNLAEAMAMSRIHLYRRLHKITGKNVSQYIREFRLEYAMELLKNDVATVSEIAYQVGFGSPTYFNKCFHKYYGYPPGEVLSDKEKKRQPILENEQNGETTYNKHSLSGKKKLLGQLNGWHILIIITSSLVLFLLIWYLPIVKEVKQIVKVGPELVTTDEKSIAVLPFRNESPDINNVYLCNGIQDAILTYLQSASDISVRSRTSVEKYRDTTLDIPIIGQEINAAYILEGSVWKLGGNIRISAQLIESKTDKHIWGEAYDITYSDTLFQIQSGIAKRIAASLRAVITPGEEKRMSVKFTTDINSYDYTIRGLQEMDNFFKYWDKKHLKEAYKYYQTAVENDPENYKALVGIGNTHLYNKHKDSALYYCDKAIRLNPEYSDSYHVKAFYYKRKSDFDKAIEYYLKTIELSPNDAMAHNQLGEIYCTQKKKVIKGFTHLNKSLELNVTSQPYIFYWVGMCYMHVGDYEKAKKLAMKMIDVELNCDGIQLYSWCLMIQRRHKEAFAFLDTIGNQSVCDKLCAREKWFHSYCKGDLEQAEKYYQELMEKGYKLAVHWKMGLANMYIQMGKKDEAVMLLDTCKTFYENSFANWGEIWYNTFNVSQVYILLGEKEKGLRYLSKAIEIGMLGGWHDLIGIDPVYQNLWGDPEFEALMDEVKEEKAVLRAQIRKMDERGEIDL